MSEKSRLVKNTGLIAIGNFGAKMVSFLLLPLYTSILSTQEYGIYDFIVAVSTFLLPIATMSMHEAMFRFIIDTGNKGEGFKKIISNSLLVVLGCNGVLGVIMTILHFTTPLNYLLAIWIYVFSNSLYVFSNNMLRGMGKIKEYAIISSGKNIVQLLSNVLVIAVFRWGVTGLLFSNCFAEFLAFLIVAAVSKIWREVKISYFSASLSKRMLTYSLPLIPNTISGQIINLSDRLIVTSMLGSGMNGIYSISYKFPNIIETVYHYFYTAWSESASRVYVNKKEEATYYYQSLYESINNMMFSVVLIMVAGMPILFRAFIRGDYIQGFDYIWILMFAMYFDSISKFYSGLFTALKKTKIMATSTLIAAGINLAINIIFIRQFGLYAAAGSTLIADFALVMIRRFYINKDIKISIPSSRVIMELLVATVIVLLTSYNNWIRISASIAIACTYGIFVNRNIIRGIVGIIKTKLSKRNKGR